MSTIVDLVFPPTDAKCSPSMALDYSSFTFWREPLPIISDIDEIVLPASASPTSAKAPEIKEKDSQENDAVSKSADTNATDKNEAALDQDSNRRKSTSSDK